MMGVFPRPYYLQNKATGRCVGAMDQAGQPLLVYVTFADAQAGVEAHKRLYDIDCEPVQAPDPSGFQFEVGDVVAIADAPDVEESYERIQRWKIVERLLQECPGGIQRHYTCKGFSRFGMVHKDYVKFNEIELKASKGFEKPDRQAQMDQMAAKIAAYAKP